MNRREFEREIMQTPIAPDDKERGTGRTTRQMEEAPKDAAFVVTRDSHGYMTALAAKLGRHDLRIVTAGQLESLRGLARLVVVDHYARERLTVAEYRLIEALNAHAHFRRGDRAAF